MKNVEGIPRPASSRRMRGTATAPNSPRDTVGGGAGGGVGLGRARGRKLILPADEVLTTTRSVRKRLDFDKPVDRAVVEECLEIALQAPTGSNRQGWHWVVIGDPELKAAVADVYRTNFEMYRAMPG